MSAAATVAGLVYPHFADSLLARRVHTYGYYASKIGRNPAKESMVIGQAMHFIGALSVVKLIPIAPLHYVERGDGDIRHIFASDILEAHHVLPHIDVLTVASRIHDYTHSEVEALGNAIEKFLAKPAAAGWTPHHTWRQVIVKKPTGSPVTYFERGLEHYRSIVAAKRARNVG